MMKLGFGKSCLTPKLGVELTGFGTFGYRRATSVEENLYARATAWEIDGVRYAMIVCDLLGFTEKLSKEIISLIARNNDMKEENVLLAATHTHTGPATGCLVGCGEPDFETIKELPAKVAASVSAAFEDLAEITSVTTNEGEFPFTFAFNRQINDDIRIDPSIRTMRINREGAKPVAIVNYSCHPVSPRAVGIITPDYPGFLCKQLEEDGFEAMYINGFCGNIDPYNTGHAGCAQNAAQLLYERSNELFDADSEMKVDSASVCGGNIPLELQHVTLAEEEQFVKDAEAKGDWPLTRMMAVCYDRSSLRLMYDPEPYTDYMEFKAFRLGKALFVFHGGEICSPFGDMIRDAFPDYTVFLAGTSFATKRYVATEKNWDESQEMYIYEISHSCKAYGCFPIARGAGEKHFAEVIKVIKENI
ncbi:MAG: hypothetical protein IJC88_03900 [Oscillospiraceae bacterium]|nr:hypothetical protein [Oscillospiraceae bacterium]